METAREEKQDRASDHELIDTNIRAARELGEFLAPLCTRYGAPAIVRALGTAHVAKALGADPANPRLIEWLDFVCPRGKRR